MLENTRRQSALFLALASSFVAALLLVRLSSYGIWDPWELGTADAARKLVAGESTQSHTGLSTWLVSFGFRFFGVHEWAGRLPIASCGLLTALLAFALVGRYARARAGLYTAIVTSTTPLFIMSSRTMLGEAPAIATQTAIALCAMGAVFPARGTARRGLAASAGWLVALAALLVLAISTRGALLGALPPLAAVGIVGLLLADRSEPGTRIVPTILASVSAALAFLIARDFFGDVSQYSMWIGGRLLPTAPPTFDAVIEEGFHAFAPWSALLPLAIASLWHRSAGSAWHDADEADTHASETPLVLVALVWTALGYAAQSLFFSRYGTEATFLPAAALGVLIALFLSQIERRGGSYWSIAIAVLFLVGLVLRDYALYPSGPVNGLPIASFDLPKVFNPKAEWALLLSAFGACALLGFGANAGAGRAFGVDSADKLSLGAPYAALREQWRRGVPYKLWLLSFALTLVALAVFGALAYAMPERMGLTTLATKWVRRLLFVAPAVPIGLLGWQLAVFAFAKLGNLRFLPMLLAGAAIGVYTSQLYLPALSAHFSPREVYDSYNHLAQANEPLGEYRVGGRAAAYYAKGKVVELPSVNALVDHLSAKQRRWVAFPADELANLDRAFRKRSGEHIVVADARSARVLLGTNLPLAGKQDESFLHAHVRKAPPATIQHPVSVNFDDRIELLGYDLKLPHASYVGAGEAFTIIWYFRCKTALPGDYKVFIHIDGEGQRIHGDHEPVDGKYPVRMWDQGDVIVDEQELNVPSTYVAGEYTIYIGFYSAQARLPIKEGPNEGDNRSRVGVLRIQ